MRILYGTCVLRLVGALSIFLTQKYLLHRSSRCFSRTHCPKTRVNLRRALPLLNTSRVPTTTTAAIQPWAPGSASKKMQEGRAKGVGQEERNNSCTPRHPASSSFPSLQPLPPPPMCSGVFSPPSVCSSFCLQRGADAADLLFPAKETGKKLKL